MTQQKLHNLRNRKRRLARRINEMMQFREQKLTEDFLASITNHINRLRNRQEQLGAMDL